MGRIDDAINYLHQRRVRQALKINSEVGYDGVCDGFLHKKRYNPSGRGLVFDMIDPFKFADREVLVSVVLNGGLNWKDFRLNTDRRGSTFDYPTSRGEATLNQTGIEADVVLVKHRKHTMKITEAYTEFAKSLLYALQQTSLDQEFQPFTFMVE